MRTEVQRISITRRWPERIIGHSPALPVDSGDQGRKGYFLGAGFYKERTAFMAHRWLRACVGLNVLMLMCVGLLPECLAQTTAPSTESSSQEAKPVAVPANTGQPHKTQTAPSTPAPDYSTQFSMGMVKRLAKDQVDLWTFPRHLTWADADIIVPFGMATGGLLATDSDFSRNLSNSPSRLNNSLKLSNYGIGAMAGVGGGMWVWGHFTHDDHMKETGFLSGEAALNAVIITEGLKYAFGRTRPLDQPQYAGNFWSGGASMPSEHASTAWAIASVIAHEYPGPLTSFLAYGLASTISTARITAKQHFPSDVSGWQLHRLVCRQAGLSRSS